MACRPREAVVVTLDIGTSSVRTLLFDARGQLCEQLRYQFTTTPDGGVELEL